MKLTDKNTNTSNTEPKMQNVTWLDVSGEQPVMRKYINGSWRPVGGGGAGGSLPTPTAEDEGKILKVVKTDEKLYNIVPTQQVLSKQNNVLVNTNLKYFKAGNTVKIDFAEGHGRAPQGSVYRTIQYDGTDYVTFGNGDIWVEGNNLIYNGTKGVLTVSYVEYTYGYDTVFMPFDTVITNNHPLSLSPNIVYNFGSVSGTLSIPQLATEGSYCNWLIIFNASGNVIFYSTTPLIWQNGEEISPESGHHYEVSINYDGNNYYATYMDFYSD